MIASKIFLFAIQEIKIWVSVSNVAKKIFCQWVVTLGNLIAPKKHRKIMVIGEIISSGKIDNTGAIELIIYWAKTATMVITYSWNKDYPHGTLLTWGYTQHCLHNHACKHTHILYLRYWIQRLTTICSSASTTTSVSDLTLYPTHASANWQREATTLPTLPLVITVMV